MRPDWNAGANMLVVTIVSFNLTETYGHCISRYFDRHIESWLGIYNSKWTRLVIFDSFSRKCSDILLRKLFSFCLDNSSTLDSTNLCGCVILSKASGNSM